MKKKFFLIIGLLVLISGTVSAAQWPITYKVNGLLSGAYQGVPFTGSPFDLQLAADATNVTPVTTFDPSSPNDLYVVGDHPFHPGPSLNGSLSIQGVGVFIFLNNLYASDSQANNLQPGIFEIGTHFEASLLDLSDIYFAQYKMMTAVKPFAISVSQAGFSSFAVSQVGGTTGDLTLTDASAVTFQAVGGVPEPSTLLLFGAGLAGLLILKKKQRC